MSTPSAPLGHTHFEFDGSGIQFRVWTRPVISDGGRKVTPMTLLWRFEDGTKGVRPCGGLIEATEYAARIINAASCGERLRN
jgi:hypothetical protein